MKTCARRELESEGCNSGRVRKPGLINGVCKREILFVRKSPLLRIDAENSNMCGNDMGTSGSNISKTETKMEREFDQRKKRKRLS